MSTFAIPMMMAGSVMSGAGQIAAGNAAYAAGVGQKQAADYQAAVLGQQATQEMAQGSQAASIARINTDYVLSAQRANAAASGGTATAPTPVDVMGRTAARGAFNEMSALYSAGEQARGLQNQANLDVYTGQQELAAGKFKQEAGLIGGAATVLSGFGKIEANYPQGASTVLSGVQSVASKYGSASGFGGFIDSGSWD